MNFELGTWNFELGTWKELNVDTKQLSVLTPTVEGSSDRDTAWMPDGTLLMSARTKLFVWKAGQASWREGYDVAPYKLGNLSRIAVSPDGKRSRSSSLVSRISRVKNRTAFTFVVVLTFVSALAAQQPQQPAPAPVYVPEVGQQGKDVVWVPTPQELVEKMLDLAKVTSKDYVIDLGSGDGRNVIAAAKRGARALGVEYNPDMVALSNRLAAEAGVAERAKFVQGDMFEADFSDATVLAMFLLPDNLTRLKPKMEKLKPGTRIVLNTFGVPGWRPDVTERIEGDCSNWCTAMLYTLPARPE